jgi:tetratricopeptide (TPR) repeat protein
MAQTKPQRQSQTSTSSIPGKDRPLVSSRRRWAFRIAAALLIPLLILALLEAGLRLAGYGHSTRFFARTKINGRDVYIQNDAFGFRFFPPEMARIPSPLVMSAEKAPGTCRIFIFGESAALGDPEPAFGFARYLQVLLSERCPGARFEVVCTAMTAINSHAILPIARECASQQGDIWVVYMGNNEFVGPFGAATVFGPQAPPLPVIRFNLALKKTRFGQWLGSLTSGSRKAGTWGGMKMFLQNQVAADDPRKQRVYAHFQPNLQDILEAARGSGAKVVLCTVADNLKDCAPFASKHSTGFDSARLEDFQRAYARGTNAEAVGDLAQALTNYLAAAQLDNGFAELQFRLGRCWLALTNSAQARRCFELARDNDALPFRADSRLNRIIRETAAARSGSDLRLADAAAVLAEKSPDGIPGRDVLFEHVHLNFDGNYLLARTMAEEVAKLLPDRFTQKAQPAWADAAKCARRLALTDWDRKRVLQNVLQREGEPPFINQLDHPDQLRRLRDAIAELRPHLTPEAASDARAVYQEALTAAPDDAYLRADSARLFEETGDLDSAIAEWQRARDLIPFAPAPYYYTGKLLARKGKLVEALSSLDRALQIRPDFPEALDETGQLLLQQKRPAEALVRFEKAATLEPQNPRLCVHRAEALARLERRAESMDQLREAVRLQPGYSEGHYLLGVELAVAGSVREAALEFLEVIKLTPNYAPGHLNLGVALARLGKTPEAIGQFRETLRLDPNNRKAQDYLDTLEHPAKKPSPEKLQVN